MSGNPTRMLPPAGGRTQAQIYEVEDFARRLRKLCLEKHWSQADLARAAFGTIEMKNKDGAVYTVARNRDRISAYWNGKAIPDPKNLQKVADALGVTPEELAPNVTAATVERERAEIAITTAAGHPDMTLLKVNTLVPLEIAMAVGQLLSNYKTSVKK